MSSFLEVASWGTCPHRQKATEKRREDRLVRLRRGLSKKQDRFQPHPRRTDHALIVTRFFLSGKIYRYGLLAMKSAPFKELSAKSLQCKTFLVDKVVSRGGTSSQDPYKILRRAKRRPAFVTSPLSSSADLDVFSSFIAPADSSTLSLTS